MIPNRSVFGYFHIRKGILTLLYFLSINLFKWELNNLSTNKDDSHDNNPYIHYINYNTHY